MQRNIKFIQTYISRVLYPKEIYPRRQYPGLDNLLFSYFLTEINKNTKNKRFFEAGNSKKLEKLAESILPFRYVLEKNPHYTVLIYGGVIKRFIRQNLWKKDLLEDVTPEVTTRLLAMKIHKILKNKINKLFEKEFFPSFKVCLVNNSPLINGGTIN